MRGRDTWDTRPCSSIGITPAYAGKRHVCNAPCKGMGDHPRVCGEEQAPGRLCSDRRRITPAYAGKRPAAWAGAWRTGDHPRVCGEKVVLSIFLVPLMGSPPRVRGKALRFFLIRPSPGITPACAGKSPERFSHPSPSRDHPRVCGEKTFLYAVSLPDSGSPPRVRGKVSTKIKNVSCKGITPACAGKSERFYAKHGKARDHPRVCGEKCVCVCVCVCVDHPRVCGEKFASSFCTFSGAGSPPRVRGKACGEGWAEARAGITPACAGKRGCDHQRQNRARDHPRVCGEKSPRLANCGT